MNGKPVLATISILASILLAGIQAPAYAGCADRWQWVNPLPQGDNWTSLTRGGGFTAGGTEGGTVCYSPDGVAWTTRLVNSPRALWGIAYGGSRFVAVGFMGDLYTSEDLVTWTPRSSQTIHNLFGVSFGPHGFVAVGNAGTIVTSPDGLAWTARNSGTGQDLLGVAWCDSRYVAVGYQGTVLLSANGQTWTPGASGTSQVLRAVTSGKGTLVAAGDGGTIRVSSDGLAWTAGGSATTKTLYGLAFEGGRFVAVGRFGVVCTSENGQAWTLRAESDDDFDTLFAATIGGGRYWAGGMIGRILSSPDGESWAELDSGIADFTILGMAFQDQNHPSWPYSYLAVGQSPGQVLWSPDGAAWTSSAVPATTHLNAVAAGRGGFHAVGDGGAILAFAFDGSVWNVRTSPTGLNLYGVAEGREGDTFVGTVAVGAQGTTLVQRPYQQWANVNSGIFVDLRAVTWTGSLFVAVGNDGTIATSSNGVSWSQKIGPAGVNFTGVAFGAGRLVAVGNTDAGQPRIYTSTNGSDWTQESAPLAGSLYAITFGAPGFLALGITGTGALRGPEGTWTPVVAGTSLTLRAALWDGKTFTAGGDRGAILRTNCGAACALTCDSSVTPLVIAPFTYEFAASVTATNCVGTPTFYWDFGDGQTGTGQDTNHTFAGNGFYNWTLSVRADDQTCTRTGTLQIGACASETTFPGWKADYFSNRSLSGTPVLSRNEPDLEFHHNWGESNPFPACLSNDEFSIRYTRTLSVSSPGTYRISGGGDDGIRVFVDGGADIYGGAGWYTHGYIVYKADVYLAAGSHSIVFEYFDGNGYAEVSFALAPSPCTLSCTATASPSSGPAPLSVAFAAAVTLSDCLGSPAYSWAFGDGQTSVEQNPTHAYAAAGSYMWSLQVTVGGLTCFRSGSVVVKEPCVLSCAATAGPSEGSAPLTVGFAGTASYPNCAGTPSFFWDFRDGSTSAEQNPTHTYAAPGDYDWNLRVTLGGQTCYQNGSVIVSAPCTLACTATASPSEGGVPLAVTFAATATPANCQGALAYFWAFGDDHGSSEQNPTHIYTVPGTYSWTLQVTAGNQTCAQAGTITVTGEIPVLSLGNESGAPDSVVKVPVTLTNGGGTACAIGFDIIYDPTFAVPDDQMVDEKHDWGGELSQALKDLGFEIVSNLLSSGRVRFGIVHSIPTNIIPDGAVAYVRFRINAGAVGTSGLDNLCQAAACSGDHVSMTCANGSLTATGPLATFSLGAASAPAGTVVKVPLSLANGGDRICAAGIDAGFDPSILSLDDNVSGGVHDYGIELSQTLQNLGFSFFSYPHDTGTVRFGIIHHTQLKTIPDGTVAYVRFRVDAAATGTTAVSNACDASDCAGDDVATTCAAGRVTALPPCTLDCAATAPDSADVNDLVAFSATASPQGCPDPVTYRWEFGDGQTSSEQNPSHWYPAGIFTWKLTASSGGTQCTRSGDILVAIPPAGGGPPPPDPKSPYVWKSIGPSWGQVDTLAVEPDGDHTLYAASMWGGGLYRGQFSGAPWTWISFPFADDHVTGLVAQSGGVVYASTLYGGVYKSTDAGDHWALLTGGIPLAYFRGLLADPTYPGHLVAFGAKTPQLPWWCQAEAPNEGGYAETFDGGATWSFHQTGWEHYVLAMAMDPVHPSKMYAATWPYDIFAATSNGGASWNPVATSPYRAVNGTTRRLSVDSCGTVWANPGPPILSEDGGATWQEPDVDWPMGEFNPMPEHAWAFGHAIGGEACYQEIGCARLYAGTEPLSRQGTALWSPPFDAQSYRADVLSLAMDPAGSEAASFFGTPLGVFRWGGWDAGTFSQANQGRLSFAWSVAVDPYDHDHIVALDDAAGLVMTRDHGATWHSSYLPYGTGVVLFDPADGETVYYGGPGGVQKSEDGGQTFDPVYGISSLAPGTPLAISPPEPQCLLFLGGDGPRLSKDAGATWTDFSSVGGDAGYFKRYQPLCVAASPVSANLFYLTAWDRSTNTCKVLRTASNEQGMYWVEEGEIPGRLERLEADPFEYRILYGTYYAPCDKGGFYISRDGGKTFTHSRPPLGPRAEDTYQPLTLPIHADPQLRGHLFMGNFKGVIESFDYGSHWKDLSYGLRTGQVLDIATSPSKVDQLALATFGQGVVLRQYLVAPDVFTVNAVVDEIQGRLPHTFYFSSSHGRGIRADRVRWDFGDRTTSEDPNPEHAYTLPGSYVVRCEWTDSTNQTRYAESLVVTVLEALGVQASATGQGGGSHDYDFAATVNGGTPPYTFDWGFGDGTPHSALAAPSHDYGAAGIYHWSIQVTDSLGLTGTAEGTAGSTPCQIACEAAAATVAAPGFPVAFAATVQASSCAQAVSTLWEFGDGATSAEPQPAHTYWQRGTYAWRLTVGAEGITCTRQGSLVVDASPDCTLTCSAAVPATATAGQAVEFQAAATADRCLNAPTYAWDFGDSAPVDPSQLASHTYTAPGNYTWGLAVTADGKTCRQTGTVVVSSPGTKPGDCNGDGVVLIGELQKAINMFLGALAPGCGVDCNGDGEVSIGELQKVINAFLGIPASC